MVSVNLTKAPETSYYLNSVEPLHAQASPHIFFKGPYIKLRILGTKAFQPHLLDGRGSFRGRFLLKQKL